MVPDRGLAMHHPDVVNITQNNVEISLILSKTWKYILNRRTGGFFYPFLRTKKDTSILEYSWDKVL